MLDSQARPEAHTQSPFPNLHWIRLMQNFAHISDLLSCKLDFPSKVWQNVKDLIQIKRVAFSADTQGFLIASHSKCALSDSISFHLCGAEQSFVRRGNGSLCELHHLCGCVDVRQTLQQNSHLSSSEWLFLLLAQHSCSTAAEGSWAYCCFRMNDN